MDVNGLRSFQLNADCGLQAWPVADAAAVGGTSITLESVPGPYAGILRIASRAPTPAMRESAVQASDIALLPSMARDSAGNYVRWDADSNRLLAYSSIRVSPPLLAVPIEVPAAAGSVLDLAFLSDGVLLVAGSLGLWLLDTRARFAPQAVDAPAAGFDAQRLLSLPDGGAAALDAGRGLVARLRGRPLAQIGIEAGSTASDSFSATDPNPDPPRLLLLPATLPAGERAVALAADPSGRLSALTVAPAGGAKVYLLCDDQRWSRPLPLSGPRFPHTLGWIDSQQLAVLTEAVALDANDQPLPQRDLGVFVYALPATIRSGLLAATLAQAPVLPLSGEFHPARRRLPGPFVSQPPDASGPHLYFTRTSLSGVPEPAPVVRIATAERPRYGLAMNAPPGAGAVALGRIDSDNPATVWHRLFLEARVPQRGALVVWLSTTDTDAPAFDADTAAAALSDPTQAPIWYPHWVGDMAALPAALNSALAASAAPRAAWLEQDSEVPRGARFLSCMPAPGSTGLFGVLIQRAGRTVRALTGRRLWLAVQFFGDGRDTPELAALRVYAGRQSYRDRYLPALYREQQTGAAADAAATASPSDFLERYLALFEGLLTDIENRVAAAPLTMDAHACPDDALPWLSSWIGLSQEASTPPLRARWMLANAAQLARRHGTLGGLELALDIATDGAVTRGRIVVVENFRLRRTLATILGAQLVDSTDPLTTGLAVSGNSQVGDTLFLSDAQEQGFLALFGANGASLSTLPAAQALFDSLAYRATVLVHDTDDDELRLIRRIASAAAPAHVLISVVAAPYPLLVSIASLVGADTYLRTPQDAAPAQLDVTSLGQVDALRGMGSLDPYAGAFGDLRGDPAQLSAPQAEATASLVPDDTAATLDASTSKAASGRRIARYRWTRLPAPPDAG